MVRASHLVIEGVMLPVEDPVLEAEGAIDNLEDAHAWVGLTVRFLVTVCVSNIDQYISSAALDVYTLWKWPSAELLSQPGISFV